LIGLILFSFISMGQSLTGFDHVFAALLELFLFPLVPLLDGAEEATDAGVDFGLSGAFGWHVQFTPFREG
jgi:hypothetical protein